MVLIADGTYCFIQKSANLEFQRETYSIQKKRNLIKPFVVCASDGTIFQKLGLNCDSDDEDEDDENNKEEDEDDFKKHPEDCQCLLSEKESSDSFETDLSDFSSISLLQSKRKMSSSSSLETVNIRPKFKDSLLSKLADILPKWGGIIETKNNLYECYKNYEVTDTCTIDYFMLAISFSVEINSRIDSLLRSNYFSNQNLFHKLIE